MPPLGHDVLATVLETCSSSALICRARAGKPFIDYNAMDMRKGVDYKQLSEHVVLLGGLLRVSPSALIAQKALTAAV